MPPVFRVRAQRLAEAGAATLLFVLLALLFHGVVLDVEYRWQRVISVAQVPGRDMNHRQIVVDLGEGWQRRLTTEEPLVHVRPGQMACIGRRHILLRRFVRYSLELPGYCRRPPPSDVPTPAERAVVVVPSREG